MDDVASLVIRIDSLEAELAKRRLDGVTVSGGRAEKATNGLTGAFLRFAGPAAIIAGSLMAIRKASQVERQFGVLNAGLITATGSAEKASIAFDAIEQFAANTPYDLAQATSGFTKLVNMGLNPSMRAMTSYGDTSAAMGKNLNDMIEAVADAATGEFERLKEFGIKARSEGDNVSFTFRGVTQTVKKEAATIEEYLIGLGETNFGGGMQLRMEELDGRISNMGDSWDSLWRTINDAGLDSLMKNTVSGVTASLDELDSTISSGYIPASLDALKGQFDTMGADIQGVWDELQTATGGTLTEIVDFLAEFAQDGLELGSRFIDFYVDAWKYLPIHARYWIQRLGIEVSAIVDYAKIYGGAFLDGFILSFKQLVSEGEIYMDAVKAFLTFDDFDLKGSLRAVQGEYRTLFNETYQGAIKSAEAVRQGRIDELELITQTREADKELYDSRLASAIALKEIQTDSPEQEDVLSQFKIIPEDQQEEEIGFWSRYLQASEESLTSLDELATSTLDRFSQGIGDAFAQWATGALDGEEAMDQFLKSMVTSTISALAQMGAQWLAYQAVQMLTGKTAATGAALALTAEAQAASLMAGIHAFASTAAIPIVGPPAAPAAMGAALAVTQPMAAGVAAISSGMVAGAFDEGGFIPSGKVGIVGEYGMEIARGPTNITGREETLKMLKNSQGGQSSTKNEVMNVNLNVSAIDSRSFEDYLQGSSPAIMGMIQQYKESKGERF